MPDRLVNRSHVLHMTGLSTASLYRRMAAGTFPVPLKLSGGIVRWKEADLAAWQASLRPAEYQRRAPASSSDAGR